MADSTTVTANAIPTPAAQEHGIWGFSRAQFGALGVMIVFLAIAPFVLYPVFLMKLLCFALFACAFNLLIGYVGLLSFGHAAYFGMGGYLAGHAAKVWGLTPELAIITGFGLGIVEGLTKVFYPEASATVIFVIMAIVLLARPAGLFGRA